MVLSVNLHCIKWKEKLILNKKRHGADYRSRGDRNIMVDFGNDWNNVLDGEFSKEYYQKLRALLAHEYKSKTIYPDLYDIFNALKYTSYQTAKVVLLGQDPYHGAGQAHGLSFSVKRGVVTPPSLQNIYKELKADLGIDIPDHGDLTNWAKQGVVLLNAVLTVQAGSPNSHKDIGWKTFTDNVVKKLNQREKPLAFFLWGANAKLKRELITSPRHLILEAAHPSPFSAYNGFFGCRHFSKANEFLKQTGQQPIDWQI